MYYNLVNYPCFPYSCQFIERSIFFVKKIEEEVFIWSLHKKKQDFRFLFSRDFTVHQFQLYCTFYTTTSEFQDQKQGCRLSYRGGRHGFSTTTCPHNRHGTCDCREVFARCPLIHIPRDRRHTLCIPRAEERI